jgi:hypothetical protein
MERFVHQETRKQENIESITAQAIGLLDENAKVDELEEDWLAHFFKQCDTVSDKEMQSLWSRLLSGEASNPKTFSKRTVDFVASMDKKDAQLFTEFCQFCWNIGYSTPIILDIENIIYSGHGVNFGSLKHFDSIGLISFDSTGYVRKQLNKSVHVEYFNTPIQIEFNKDSNNELQIGKVLLTQIGEELSTVCGAKRNDEFYEYVIKQWYERGLILSTPIIF